MKKILSDGTVAKKGMIVVVINGITAGNMGETVTKIISLVPDDHELLDTAVECEWWIDGIKDSITMTEELCDIRKATPKEESIFNGE